MKTEPSFYRGFRFPAEIISHAVWLYHCFSLSLREVELILAQRGIAVSYESVRAWGLRFGRAFANSLKRRRPGPGDKWHLDEVFLRIRGKLHYLWRAVDQHGTVLDILMQSRRSAKAANCFFKKLLKGLQYVPRVIVTDKLRSYGAAKRKVLPGVEHRQSRYLDNRAEVSHQPTRRRERLTAWRFWLQAPILGHGLNSFTVQHRGGRKLEGSHPHNVVLQILAELGLVGLVLFSAFSSPATPASASCGTTR